MFVARSLIAISRVAQVVAVFVFGLFALALVAYTTASALGFAPWLQLPLTFGETVAPDAGMYLQIALTVLVAVLAFMIPTNMRVMKLEQSHRKFQLSMDDVARAYHLCHTADRAGVFTMSSEFDAVRERLAFMRDHPDLEELEGDVLEVAAQMSEQSRDLAKTYSDEKVARAKKFLTQRQEEAEAQQERIVEALHTCTEIRKWAQQVEVEESIVESQMRSLDETLQSILPQLGYSIEHEDDAEVMEVPAEEDVNNIVQLPQKPAAE